MTPHQVSVAGEAFAACLFAQVGADVLIQYGANQPDYDFVALVDAKALRVSVKATQREGWGLIQSYKRGRTYHQAADDWAADQPKDVIFALVSFWRVAVGEAPRCYIATPAELAEHHKSARNGAGHTTLYEDKTPVRGIGKHARYQIPAAWRFSEWRIKDIFNRSQPHQAPAPSAIAVCPSAATTGATEQP